MGSSQCQSETRERYILRSTRTGHSADVSADHGFPAGQIDNRPPASRLGRISVDGWCRRMWRAAFWLGTALLGTSTAYAGPPFITDDPEPVELGHWEEYVFSAATHVQGDTSGILAGTEVNYGAAPNLQLHIIVPLAFDSPNGGRMGAGLGDTELGAKYRFITSGEKDWWPQVAMFPLIEVPTGNATRGFGTGRTHVYLPVWLQKDFGHWTTYGGGGYWINPGPGNKNYWFAGWLLQRQLTKRFALGTEIFRQTAARTSDKTTVGFNVGGIYDITEHYHLLLSAGRGLENATKSNKFSYYFAIQRTF
jgi:hypothetical protein